MMADEFDRLTVEELARLRAIWFEREQRLDMRAARVCWVIAESNRTKPPAFDPADFFPSLNSLRPAPPTDEEMERKLDAVFGG